MCGEVIRAPGGASQVLKGRTAHRGGAGCAGVPEVKGGGLGTMVRRGKGGLSQGQRKGRDLPLKGGLSLRGALGHYSNQ